MEEEVITKHIQQGNIKLNVGMNKNYGWELRLSGDDLKNVIGELEEINNLMLEKFKNKK